MIRPEFLREIEARGYMLRHIDQDRCIAKCSTKGCGMTIEVKPGGFLPSRNLDPLPSTVIEVETFDDARRHLRERRRGLHLNKEEVEEGAGLARDHLAKFERDNYSRVPNVELFMFWAQFLGYKVALVPTVIPPITARIVAENRGMVQARERRNVIERRREKEPPASK